MVDAFIAIDLGAQSGRVMLGVLTDDAFALHEAHRFANEPKTVDGVLCWDTESLLEQTFDGLREAVRMAAGLQATVRGIAVDSWGVDYALVGPDGSLAAPMRHYRAASPADMESAALLVDPSSAYARTGIVELPINTCFQLHRDARAGLLDGPVQALLVPDFWVYRLTGVRSAERTIASTTGLLDRRTGEWSTQIAEALGIPMRTLPPLASSGCVAGLTTAEVTERIGAGRPIPVLRTPGHDTACAFAGVAEPGDGRAVISCGTWALVGCAWHHPVLDERARMWGFTNEEGFGGSITLIRNLSGTWLLEECLRQWSQASGEPIGPLRARLLADAALIAPGSIPARIDVGDPELMSPGDMPQRIGEAVSRTAGRAVALPPALTVAVVIDSLAAAFARAVQQAAELTGAPLTEILMIGGGSNIELLVQRTREISGLPVTVGHPEATSIGSICVQAVASGMMPTIDEARRRTAPVPRG